MKNATITLSDGQIIYLKSHSEIELSKLYEEWIGNKILNQEPTNGGLKVLLSNESDRYYGNCLYQEVYCANQLCRSPVGKYFLTKSDIILGTICFEKGSLQKNVPRNTQLLVDGKIHERELILESL